MPATRIEVPGYGTVTVEGPKGRGRWVMREASHVGQVPASPFDIIDAVRTLLRGEDTGPECDDNAVLLGDVLTVVGAIGALVDQARAHNANNSDSDTLDHLDLRAVAQFSRRLASFAQVALNHIEVIEIEQAELWGDAGAVAAE